MNSVIFTCSDRFGKLIALSCPILTLADLKFSKLCLLLIGRAIGAGNFETNWAVLNDLFEAGIEAEYWKDP